MFYFFTSYRTSIKLSSSSPANPSSTSSRHTAKTVLEETIQTTWPTWNTQRILILMIIAHDNDDNEPIPVALHDASEPPQTYSASSTSGAICCGTSTYRWRKNVKIYMKLYMVHHLSTCTSPSLLRLKDINLAKT